MMKENRDLLVEIGTEELPPKALWHLAQTFRDEFEKQLASNILEYTSIETYATPRRLALLVKKLVTRQPHQEIIRHGPLLTVAFDSNGKPTKAAEGFAHSCGIPIQELSHEESAKGTRLVFNKVMPGKNTIDIIAEVTGNVLESLPIPKRMRWGDRNETFIRPVHWITMVFGEEPVTGSLFGIDVGNFTIGHRFHRPSKIRINSASAYVDIIRMQGMVEPSFECRRELIRKKVEELAKEANGKALIEDVLLEEVTALCEWPCAILGSFDETFLEIPAEVLIETMQKHQKYFPVLTINNDLLPYFITISNIQSIDPSQVRAGNERVLRPRFTDAAFFWHQDLKQPLDAFAPKLKKVVFHERLGSLADKTDRLISISRNIAGLLGKDKEAAARAAQLAKCDLTTQMIYEFPSLQGIMGKYYAKKSGEDTCVASAIEQQYYPRHAGDKLPSTDSGLILSIADRLDTLVGIFSVGERPTGEKDPYALRRTAIGLLRILIETPLPLDLYQLLVYSAKQIKNIMDIEKVADDVFNYCLERLQGYYEDKAIGRDVVDSVLAIKPRIPSDIHQRILAVERFRLLPEAKALAAANKRIANILRKSGMGMQESVDFFTLKDDAEHRLANSISKIKIKIIPLTEVQDYQAILMILSTLREDIDYFFDQVMILTEDQKLRCNRLSLLQEIMNLFLTVADISILSDK